MKDNLEKFGYLVKYRTQDSYGSWENKQSTEGHGTHRKMQELAQDLIYLAHRCGAYDGLVKAIDEAKENCRLHDEKQAKESAA